MLSGWENIYAQENKSPWYVFLRKNIQMVTIFQGIMILFFSLLEHIPLEDISDL